MVFFEKVGWRVSGAGLPVCAAGVTVVLISLVICSTTETASYVSQSPALPLMQSMADAVRGLFWELLRHALDSAIVDEIMRVISVILHWAGDTIDAIRKYRSCQDLISLCAPDGDHPIIFIEIRLFIGWQ